MTPQVLRGALEKKENLHRHQNNHNSSNNNNSNNRCKMNNIRLLLRDLAAPGAVAGAGALADTPAVDLDIAAPGAAAASAATVPFSAMIAVVAVPTSSSSRYGYRCWLDAAGDVVGSGYVGAHAAVVLDLADPS